MDVLALSEDAPVPTPCVCESSSVRPQPMRALLAPFLVAAFLLGSNAVLALRVRDGAGADGGRGVCGEICVQMSAWENVPSCGKRHLELLRSVAVIIVIVQPYLLGVSTALHDRHGASAGSHFAKKTRCRLFPSTLHISVTKYLLLVWPL